MKLELLSEILKLEPAYRQKQISKAIFCDLISNWNEATVLPIVLREKLNKLFSLEIESEIVEGKDAKKALVTLFDGLRIETVLIEHGDNRNTVCVSSQVGCAMGCKFCATGKLGFKRDLTAGEIINQVLLFARLLKRQNRKISNVVVMGMGEPFLNYDNVLEAIKILHDPNGFNLGARHFSISTCGIISGIEKLSNEKLQINLAISLHAPNDKLRTSLMPIGKEYSINKILSAVDEYIAKTNRRVMFEYLLIDKVNDTEECVRELIVLMKKPLYMVNLICYNETGVFASSKPQTVRRFMNSLEKAGVGVTLRHSFGNEFEAACGQLAGKKSAKT